MRLLNKSIVIALSWPALVFIPAHTGHSVPLWQGVKQFTEFHLVRNCLCSTLEYSLTKLLYFICTISLSTCWCYCQWLYYAFSAFGSVWRCFIILNYSHNSHISLRKYLWRLWGFDDFSVSYFSVAWTLIPHLWVCKVGNWKILSWFACVFITLGSV